MDIYEVLRADHQEIKEIMTSLAKKKNEELFHEFQEKMIAHNKAEEEIFYDALTSKLDSLEIIPKAGTKEHDLASKIIDKLAKIDDEAEWKILFSLLKKTIEAHVKKEEEDVFSLAEKHFSATEAKEMGKAMKSRKKEIQESGYGLGKITKAAHKVKDKVEELVS